MSGDNELNVRDIAPAVLLAVLYNRARVQGLGVLHSSVGPMEAEEAAALLMEQELPAYFDYLKGRVMKVEIDGKTLNPRLYDRDNGHKAAEECVNQARAIMELSGA
jgi:hypothetical protein